MRAATGWKDFELLDAADGEKLERWGDVILARPDPQVIWKGERKASLWKDADAVYTREGGGGRWTKLDVPASWEIGYGGASVQNQADGLQAYGPFS